MTAKVPSLWLLEHSLDLSEKSLGHCMLGLDIDQHEIREKQKMYLNHTHTHQKNPKKQQTTTTTNKKPHKTNTQRKHPKNHQKPPQTLETTSLEIPDKGVSVEAIAGSESSEREIQKSWKDI